MKQRAVLLGPGPGLAGVVTSPNSVDPDLPVVLLLNAGMLHRVGPNRLYVQLAARLATLGYRVLRFDFSGVGDSPPSDSKAPFEERTLRESQAAMEFATRHYDARSFVPMGFCSGADVAFSLALSDHRVVGAVLINGGFAGSDVSPDLRREAEARLRARYYRGRLFDPGSWSRLLSLKSDLGAIQRTVARLWSRPARSDLARPGRPPIGDDVRRLAETGVTLLGVYSEGSVTWELLQLLFGARADKLCGLENVRLEYVASVDHMFTPLWAQARLLDLVCSWLPDGKLKRSGKGARS